MNDMRDVTLLLSTYKADYSLERAISFRIAMTHGDWWLRYFLPDKVYQALPGFEPGAALCMCGEHFTDVLPSRHLTSVPYSYMGLV